MKEKKGWLFVHTKNACEEKEEENIGKNLCCEHNLYMLLVCALLRTVLMTCVKPRVLITDLLEFGSRVERRSDKEFLRKEVRLLLYPVKTARKVSNFSSAAKIYSKGV